MIAKAAGGSCPGAISVASLAFGKGSLSTSTSIPSVLAPAGLLSSAANAQAVAATRCSTARAPAALNTSPADFYFCLTYTPGAGTGALDGASFEKSAGAFVEVRARLFDPRTGTDLSCAGYAAAPLTASVRIGYALYWRSKAAGTPAGAAAGTQAWLHNSKLGFFYAHP